jgi:hypothetical protein
MVLAVIPPEDDEPPAAVVPASLDAPPDRGWLLDPATAPPVVPAWGMVFPDPPPLLVQAIQVDANKIAQTFPGLRSSLFIAHPFVIKVANPLYSSLSGPNSLFHIAQL